MSIVGKVYTGILNNRLISWCEENKILLEEQGGFRPRRGCPDQIFSLSELLKNRKDISTYCCFIDVRKAFDRVHRNGLWTRLADEGIKSKMWRVIKSLYGNVQSCVLVEDSETDWFDVDTGVRQGCVLSPVLFAIFINGLAREIKAQNLGIDISENIHLNILLYADDIVLISDKAKRLQKMLNLVTEYARKWRFEMNRKKSQVVSFCKKPRSNHPTWKLGGGTLSTVTCYKYLGIELTKTLNWRTYLKRITKKARRNMTKSFAMGIRTGHMSVGMSNNLWQTLVRPVVEYGSEIWGDCECKEIDKLQLEMGRRILKRHFTTAREVIRGELGWWLRFWA